MLLLLLPDSFSRQHGAAKNATPHDPTWAGVWEKTKQPFLRHSKREQSITTPVATCDGQPLVVFRSKFGIGQSLDSSFAVTRKFNFQQEEVEWSLLMANIPAG